MKFFAKIVCVLICMSACSDTSTHERHELTDIRLIEPIAEHGEIELVEPMAIKVVSDRYFYSQYRILTTSCMQTHWVST